ncbi:FAD-linked oxidoreductase -like [Brachionus plicatilis]|uniref:FAD-linked oxidoreductase-like n=1 Tax=Brachionus plicatilis TaxID=10195 RepID=A0A3M7PT34_BRAPC|nr:FAD-linked oxidoreductase -like [Brachionus plicatilis]
MSSELNDYKNTLNGHVGYDFCLQLIDQFTLASGIVDKTIKIWDLRNYHCTKQPLINIKEVFINWNIILNDQLFSTHDNTLIGFSLKSIFSTNFNLFLLSENNLIIFNTVSNRWCFKYALPGDSNWPTLSDFVDMESKIEGRVYMRGDDDYKPHTWNKRTLVPKPAVIIQPSTNNDIIEALKFAKKFNLRLSVQSTGHHQDNRNILDNSVHIDMSSMNQKSIDLEQKTVTLGPGNNFTQIYKFVEEQSNKSLVVVSGADPGVGIYGWTVGGGHGPLSRLFGLGVDNLLSIDLILANYSLVTLSESQKSDIFRAIRGSGGSTYGIAVSLTIKLHPSPGKMSVFVGNYDLSSTTADLVSDWITILEALREDYLQLAALMKEPNVGCIPSADFQITCNPSYDAFDSYFEYFKTAQSERGGSAYLASTALNSQNIKEALREILEFIDSTPFTGCSGNAVLGGFSSTLDPSGEKTSISREFRNGLMGISCYSMMEESTPVNEKRYQVELMDTFSENVLKKYSNWVYWNEPQHNFPQNDWKERYWGGMDNYNKLLEAKVKLDPENLFTCYHCVGYERQFNEMPSVCPQDGCTCSNTPNGVCAVVDDIRCWYNATSFSDQCESAGTDSNSNFFNYILQYILE